MTKAPPCQRQGRWGGGEEGEGAGGSGKGWGEGEVFGMLVVGLGKLAKGRGRPGLLLRVREEMEGSEFV